MCDSDATNDFSSDDSFHDSSWRDRPEEKNAKLKKSNNKKKAKGTQK